MMKAWEHTRRGMWSMVLLLYAVGLVACGEIDEKHDQGHSEVQGLQVVDIDAEMKGMTDQQQIRHVLEGLIEATKLQNTELAQQYFDDQAEINQGMGVRMVELWKAQGFSESLLKKLKETYGPEAVLRGDETVRVLPHRYEIPEAMMEIDLDKGEAYAIVTGAQEYRESFNLMKRNGYWRVTMDLLSEEEKKMLRQYGNVQGLDRMYRGLIELVDHCETFQEWRRYQFEVSVDYGTRSIESIMGK